MCRRGRLPAWHSRNQKNAVAARLDTVCRLICETGGWNVSNLQLQKVLYIAQMLHMGNYTTAPESPVRLVEASFEAWDYGPVVPALYHRVKMFGSRPIADVFSDARRFNESDPRRSFLVSVSANLLRRRPGELVEITHWREGAWAELYVPGERGIEIPDTAILAEYHKWIERRRVHAQPD